MNGERRFKFRTHRAHSALSINHGVHATAYTNDTCPAPMWAMSLGIPAKASPANSAGHIIPFGDCPTPPARTQRATTTLTGDMTDQEELQGVISLLVSLGVEVVDVLTVPESAGLRSQ